MLIAISVLLVNEGIPPSTSQMKIIRKYIRQLVRDRKKLESFENKQNIAKRNLIRFHGFFISPKNHTQEDCPTKEKNSNDLNSSLIYLNKLTPDDDLDNDHFGIDLIISYVRKFIKCSGNDYIERYIRWEFPDLGNSYIPNKSTNSLLVDSRHSSLISYNSTANNSLLLNENNLDDFSEISKISDVDICDVESSNCTLSLSRCSQIPINIEISETTKRLKALFTDWNTAYEATIAVWEVMQNERDYDVQELMNSLSFPYAMFLVSAINSYQNDR
ncbi:hypothetical protein TRFO_42026 [Tritrichomonas foetus]|uniref:Uncharacterized protein n=1 Tax=Tritrichomonas foetus TaxID=1144522 RepID=A0A1J4L2G4_9EUKA|nr:hypothetical protein TRFO_42026 [Tritrichomonas foetus]|eukprot:OHT16156.1 hypothetical protein TRFO_42026 [Tritrichomonas foetus]